LFAAPQTAYWSMPEISGRRQAVAAFDAARPAKHRDDFIAAAARYRWSRMTQAYLDEYAKVLAHSRNTCQ